MEGKFDYFVLDELRRLIEDIEGARQPRNLILGTIVKQHLRDVYERDHCHLLPVDYE